MPARLLRKLFGGKRAASGVDVTDYDSLHDLPGGAGAEYDKLASEQLRRLRIAPECAGVHKVLKVGTKQGKDSLVVVIRLHTWQRESAVRLLIGLPMLEKKMRESVRAMWLADVSHFEGVWLQAAGELQSRAVLSELRGVLLTLRKRDRAEQPATTQPEGHRGTPLT